MRAKNIFLINVLLLTLIAGCASTGSGTSSFSLQEAIEQSAEKIAAELPTGSRVAIVAFESENVNLSDYIMAELSSALFDRGLEVADRQNLAFVYKELNFNMSGDVSDETAQSIGKMLGARLVITGSLTSLGRSYRYRTNAIHVEQAIRASDTRLTVRNDREMRNMVAALANQSSMAKMVEYDQKEQNTPKSAGNFLDRGILFASRGDYDMAISDFTDALNINPNLAAAYYNRGFAYHRKNDFDKAITDYTQAIRINPNDSVAYMYRGYAYFAKSKDEWGQIISATDFDRAITEYTQAIRIDTNYADAYYNRGDAYYAKRDYNRAISDYDKAIQIDPAAWRYAARGEAYFAIGNYNRALSDFDQAIRLNPTGWRYTQRGRAYFAIGNEERGISDYIKALELSPTSGRYNDLIRIYLAKGESNLSARIRINDGKYYRIQVGSFMVRQFAWETGRKLMDAGFYPDYEEYGNLLRVVVPRIRGTDVPSTFEKIIATGFLDLFVREEI